MGKARASDAKQRAGRAHSAESWRLLDPELVPGLKRIIRLTDAGPEPDRAAMYPGAVALPPPAPQAIERRILGPSGAADLRIVLIEPEPNGRNRPALLHTHGGGFIAGGAELSRSLQRIAQACSCVVVSVDYRLAPATHFPGSLEDNYAALRWLYHNAEALGVDRRRIAVGGESAGGGHAAMLAIAARDRGEIPLAYQWLIYPMLDDRTGLDDRTETRGAVPPHIGTFIWTRESNQHGWTAFLGRDAGAASVPEGAVPARVADVSCLPPTYIGVGSLDLFVQENIDFAARLNAAGVPVELHVVPGAYHGFDVIAPEAAVSRRFTQNWLDALSKAFAMQR